MLELLFLLLPLAAVYGYIMGRSSVRSKKLNSKNDHNATYLRGVEYLLNHNQEKAVDKFIAYLNSSDPTFETRLALGNLLRQRGESDKAIALHEKMAQDQSLDEIERELSSLELSRDFLNAGVFDRAEELLKQLIEVPRQRGESARLLLKVYEREGDYEAAISVASSFKDELGHEVIPRLADYYCEIADRHLVSGDDKAAQASCQKALEICPDRTRARLILAEIALRHGDVISSRAYIKAAYTADPNSGLICIDFLKRCFPNRADPEYRFALEDLVHRTSSASAMAELVRITEQQAGSADAEAMLLNYLHEKPNLKLFSTLMELRSHKLEARENTALMQLKSLIDAQVAQSSRFVCRKCGFESSVMFWQCPSCRKWGSLNPKHGIDGD